MMGIMLKGKTQKLQSITNYKTYIHQWMTDDS
jgi:hypothetical protein